MANTLKCLRITMQTVLEEPNTHELEKELIHSLCNAFKFWYSTINIDEYTLSTDIYIHTYNDVFYSDFKSIIKTFALIEGYSILYSRIVEQPKEDDICLNKK